MWETAATNISEIIGFLAAFLTTVSFIPQAIKIIRDKKTESISFGMYLLFTIGVFLWLIYGLLIGGLPVIVANAITFLLALSILIMKIRLG